MSSVLVVDDEETHARAVARFLGRRGFAAAVATSGAEARSAIASARPDLVLLDLRLGDDDGMALLREWLASDADLPVVMMTAYGSVDSAVAAMKSGARDYIQKPVDLEELALVIDRALAEARAQACLERMQQGPAVAPGAEDVLGGSAAMEPVRDFLARMAALDGLRAGDYPTILLLGETGTGKSLVARALHRSSRLARRPFLVLDCTALPRDLIEAELFGFERGAFTDAKAAKPGLIEVATGGMLFLDEIGELGPDAQAKLLRVLEEKTMRRVGGLRDITVDVRIVAATNRDPAREVEAGRLRRDLFYRLNVLSLTLPPLRERGDDAVLLARHFVEVYARKYGRPAKALSPDATSALLLDPWIGNVRELAHAIERAMLLVDGDAISAVHLGRGAAAVGEVPAPDEAPPLGALPPAASSLDDVEREMIRQALADENGNVSRAARRLGVSRELLRYRVRKHGLR
ncbi:MAG TPA: sigma-54 dependent transcriptional regulator [Candidatus Binatia bacterium]|nr:sigma-54 dependent transcriptional regulator [Candidatus Binatia bacterium]